MYPTDLWPNGVEVPFEEFTVYENKGMFSGDTTMQDSSGWDFMVIPIKGAHRIVLNDTNLEWTYWLDENLNKNTNQSILNGAPYASGNILYSAPYIGKNLRGHRTFSGITFYYYPTNGAERNVSNYKNSWSDFMYCAGAEKLHLGFNSRGSIVWYGEDKNLLFSRPWGEEAGVYIVPEGAYYAKYNGNAPYAVGEGTINYWLE